MQDRGMKAAKWCTILFASLAALYGLAQLGMYLWLRLQTGLLLNAAQGSVGIIGGADGPTAVFVTSGGAPWNVLIPLILVLGTGISAAVWMRLGRREK